MTDVEGQARKERILFIGGHPKGYSEAFSPKTVSGRNLRRIVDKLGLRVVDYFDLWKNETEEKKGWVDLAKRVYLRRMFEDGVRLVPLGHYVRKRLSESGFSLLYYPHPASRNPADLEVLEVRLRKFA